MKATTASVLTGSPPVRARNTPKPESSYSLRHRHRPWVVHQKLVILSFLGDFLVVSLSLLAAYFMRFETELHRFGVYDPAANLQNYIGHLVLGTVLLMFLLGNFRLHDPRNFLSPRKTIWVILKSCAAWLVAFLALTVLLKIEPPVSRIFCLLAAGISCIGLLGWRWFLYGVFRNESIASSLRQKVLFVGWNRECERITDSSDEVQRIEVVGVVEPPKGSFLDSPPENIQLIGRHRPIRKVLRDTEADVVMAVDGSVQREYLLELAETCGKEFVDFKLVPSCFQILISGLEMESVNGLPVLGIGKMPLHHALNNVAKRALDIVGAIMGLVFFAPVMAVFAAAVYLESPGPVIYRQRRIGLNGMPFDIFKIRSMKPDAESDGAPGWTVKDDPRRLKVGAFMRRWNIDELPQFWNVLKGEMSLVGPRPERPELIEKFKEEIPHYNVRHNIKPGLTGWAQVNGLRGDTSLHERIKFDLDYIENWHFFFDLKIMLMTFFSHKGAC